MQRFLIAISLLLFCNPVLAYGWYGPEPFRLDRLEGHNLELTKESFLHRFSFQPMPVVQMRDVWAEDGWYGTAGSTRSREFYVQSHMQKRVQFDAPMFVGVRFRRDEDLDGRFDYTSFGSGYAKADGSLELGIWGDIRGDKERIDLQLESYWQPSDRQWLRATLVSPDVIYNSKTYDDHFYQRSPLTLHLTGGSTSAGGQQLYGFANLNRQMEFHQPELQQQWSDKQISVGLGWLMPLGQQWQIGVQSQGLHGERQLLQSDMLAMQLRRQFSDTTLELQRQSPSDVSYWGGLRYLTLRERDTAQTGPARQLEQRDEWMLYGGMAYSLRDWIRFKPTLILSYTEAKGFRPNDDKPLSFNGLLAKLSPLLELHMDQKTGAIIRLNPTLELHDLSFGGGNVQVHIPF